MHRRSSAVAWAAALFALPGCSSMPSSVMDVDNGPKPVCTRMPNQPA